MTTDYSALGLDPYLNSLNSPAALGNNNITQSAFDASMDWSIVNTPMLFGGAITSAKIANAAIGNAQLGTAIIGTAQIGTLNWQQSSGGTATFGGTTNGNGLVQVLNQSGGTVVKLDNTGMTVNNGSIIVQNSSGSNIIDSQGIVSTNNFKFVGLSVPNQNVVGSGATRIDLGTASLSIVLSRSAQILFLASTLPNLTTNASIQGNWNINVGGTELIDGVFQSAFSESLQFTQTLYSIKTVGAGTTTYKLQCFSFGTMVFQQTQMHYLVLGN